MTQPDWMNAQVRTAPVRPPLNETFFRTARVLQGLLGLTVLMQFVMLAADWFYLGLAERLIATPRQVPLEDLQRSDTVTMWTTFAQLGLLLVTGIAFISWLYQAHRSDRVNPGVLRHESSWAIIAWFIPVLSLFRPYQMINDTRRGADPLAEAPSYQAVWWGAFLLGRLGDGIVGALWPTGEEPGLRTVGENLKTAAVFEVGSGLLNILAAMLAIELVRGLTATLRDSPRGERVSGQTSVRPS